MAAVTSYDLTGDAYIDGVLGQYKWAVNSLTFSFPTSSSYYGLNYGSGEPLSNFGVLSTVQQSAARSALRMFAAGANLSFTEIAETTTQHADLRFAMSGKPGTAWAYFPSATAEGGDAWFNHADYNTPVKGNYAYLTFVHEIGHALGLEHAHEHFVMPADRDSMEYTVMSYRSYVGASTTSGYVNETWGYAQSLMMYDIAALQHMYGANHATNSGNTTYGWDPVTGEMTINGVSQGVPGGNKILLTVWDGGGTDTYDFSKYTGNLKVDLRPGEWTTTSTAQLAKLSYDGSKVAVGNIANALLYKGDARSLIENAIGGSGSDILTGNDAANSLTGGAGNDRLIGGKNNDVIDGGLGTDTVVFSSLRSNYSVTELSDGSLQVGDVRSGAPDGKDVVWGIEWFEFGDRIYSFNELVSSMPTLADFGATAGGWASADRYPRELADVNGDGRADIVGFGEAGVYVALANGNGSFQASSFTLADFGATAGGWANADRYPRELADVNGDGRADIVGFGEAGVYVALANGDGSFQASSFTLADFGATAGGWASADRYPRELADVNGDGRADIVGFGEAGVYVALANGDGSFQASSFTLADFGATAGGWASADRYPRELADVNGDGRADIVGFGEAGVYVALANGNGSFLAPSFTLADFGATAGGWANADRYPRELADVNGDGRADIVGFGEAGVYVALANGNGSFQASSFTLADFGATAGGWANADRYPRELADVNGDGRADIVGFGEPGVYVALARDAFLL